MIDQVGGMQYEENAAAVFVGTALQALRRGRWQQLEIAPQDYGIPQGLFEGLRKYKEEYPVLLEAAIDEQLAKREYTALLKGEDIEIQKVEMERHLPKEKQGSAAGIKKKKSDSKGCSVS